MNYRESTVYLESLSPTVQKPCLERIDAFMAECGRQQGCFESIHIGGTNGKGSTVAMLDSIIRAADLKVGRFTGPHLLRWNERFHVDGKPISDERFAELATNLRALSEDFGSRHPHFGPLTWFEFLAAMSFVYFAESKVDIAVFEVGLGGRWDATNVLGSPLASAITNIDLDHTQILGATVEAIAREKAGIAKPGSPMVTGASGPAFEEIRSAAQAVRAPLFHCTLPGTIQAIHPECSAISSRIPSTSELSDLLETRLRLSLAGRHQQANALLALAVLLVSGLKPRLAGKSSGVAAARKVQAVVSDGLQNVYWPGRFQLLENLSLVLDGAHNPAGARALRRSLSEVFPDKRFLFIVGCFQNKDVPAYIDELVQSGDSLIACEASSRREVYSSERLLELVCGKRVESSRAGSVPEALNRALSQRRADEMVVVTGSFATVREVMLDLGWQQVEDGLAATCMNWVATGSARLR